MGNGNACVRRRDCDLYICCECSCGQFKLIMRLRIDQYGQASRYGSTRTLNRWW